METRSADAYRSLNPDAAPIPAVPAANTAPAVTDWQVACLNCGSALSGPFCAECGQRAAPPHPRLSELAGDAFAEFSGWDGKFAETIRLLVRRPGELTRQFIEGRRVSFISPVRLYFAMSVVYFLLAAAAPEPADRSRPGDVAVAGVHFSVGVPGSPKTPQQISAAVADAREGVMTPAERDSTLARIAKAPARLRPVFRRAILDPSGFRRAVLELMPKVLFALVPVFAGIVAIFYRRRHFPEHLYFALHLHAFVFLALMTGELAKFTGVHQLASAASLAATIWIPCYVIVALRRVYGGSLPATIARGAGIGVLYMLAGSAALVGMVFLPTLGG